ncbi:MULTISPECIES: hypothetical protein [unclassified Wenzhouxiangella]|uniref:hypothetical protein n=1 Tax=unclassified Wenzhouxiangella TaxID=2613841 RepID=UPI000E32C300|nr:MULTISPECIES: hypothetical protein [unclassified Wenzhouxiangella]RFF27613.1 hypothetical protein DZK25_07035 [Wenzhouxiangella sp. 15181]RFP70137.1 hypothetical protein DZK26_01040 [Wenzhouxiangella sp. 15190]
MIDAPVSLPPVHFWIIAVIAVLWNAVGAFDFIATQMRLESYMSAFTEEQLAYFYGIPAWAVATWGIAIVSALLGSVAMLLRLRRAYELFIISFIAMLMTSFQNFVLSNGAEIMGAAGLIFSGVIVAIGIFLIFYNRAMLQRGVLR